MWLRTVGLGDGDKYGRATGNGDAVKEPLILIPTFLEAGGRIAIVSSAKISLLRLLKMHVRLSAVQNGVSLLLLPLQKGLCVQEQI